MSASARGVTYTRLAFIFLVLLTVYLLRDSWLPEGYQLPAKADFSTTPLHHTESEEHLRQSDIQQVPAAPQPCRVVPGADDVMVLLKTGATELYQKLPTHFLTTFKCMPHFMIFSDLAQEFADYPIYDAIESVSEHFRHEHPDFELYRKVRQHQREGQDISKLSGHGSWNLDKWKFLPMMHKAFATAGENIEWFVIMEADTSLSWTNLLQWLKTMDPQEPYYLGAQNVIGDTAFAHGGSGIVISRRAADLLEETRVNEGQFDYDEKWEELVSKACCGDEVIARALLEAGVPLTPAWPLIQGETVASLDWTKDHWCTPAVSWHHVTPTEIDALWQFERTWIADHGWNTPYLYRDVFSHFVERHVSVNRTNWNNLSKDRKFASHDLTEPEEEHVSQLRDYEENAVESQDACAEACLQMDEDECIQWMYSPGRCYLGKDIRFGKCDEREQDHWTSGWIQDRLHNFKRRFEGCEIRWSG